MLTIALGNDHTAFPIRQDLIQFLEEELQCRVLDFGTDSDKSTDYPLYAHKVARAVLKGDAGLGILMCGTGVGISIAANKIRGIRCALCYTPEVARMVHRHNNPNILAFGVRTQSLDEIKSCLHAFMEEKYEGGRHERRLELIRKLEIEQEDFDGGH